MLVALFRPYKLTQTNQYNIQAGTMELMLCLTQEMASFSSTPLCTHALTLCVRVHKFAREFHAANVNAGPLQIERPDIKRPHQTTQNYSFRFHTKRGKKQPHFSRLANWETARLCGGY